MTSYDPYLDYTMLISLLITGVSLVIIVYELLLLSDFEGDDINSIDFCRKMNNLIPKEYAVHFGVCGILIFGARWLILLANLPLAIFDGYKFYKQRHRLDPTKIYQVHNTVGQIVLGKLVFFMVMFFVYLFLLLYSLIED
eukprot:TRINITY_DN9640_c0_g1_i1.p1 TRINITY_DN9640_c0_g1~~TRINITY_DN9640_c0_g1_i1.p1  ORF type:complete len:140 (-),score=15.88 TRINITY_DN9640_c0_g1_i1:70-489(-)